MKYKVVETQTSYVEADNEEEAIELHIYNSQNGRCEGSRTVTKYRANPQVHKEEK